MLFYPCSQGSVEVVVKCQISINHIQSDLTIMLVVKHLIWCQKQTRLTLKLVGRCFHIFHGYFWENIWLCTSGLNASTYANSIGLASFLESIIYWHQTIAQYILYFFFYFNYKFSSVFMFLPGLQPPWLSFKHIADVRD